MLIATLLTGKAALTDGLALWLVAARVVRLTIHVIYFAYGRSRAAGRLTALKAGSDASA